MGRRFERHVNWDLVERILASGPIKKTVVAKTRVKVPRDRSSYRANGGSPQGKHRVSLAAFRGGPFLGPILLNRSERWPRARSYAQARDLRLMAEAAQ